MHYLITGGVRSGKSKYAQDLALLLTPHPVYLATSRIWDEDFARRIARHKLDRNNEWENIEIEKDLSQISLQNRVIVIDCVTLWLTNIFTDQKYNLEVSLSEAKKELQKLLEIPNQYVFITNELGLGGHAVTEMGRNFADLQGWFNQHLAEKVDKLVLMVCGIPLPIK